MSQLYRHHDLAAAPERPFLVAGCEESADAARRLIGDAYVVTAWPERHGAWKSVDIRPLTGRKGVLLPDSSPGSHADMASFADRLADVGCSIRLVRYNSKPDGWTLVDFQGSRSEFVAWATEHATDYVKTQPEPSSVAAGHESEHEIPLEAYEEEGGEAPPPIALSEDAFGRLFAQRYGDTWRCVRAWNKWFYWDGEAWAEDRTDSRVQPMRELFQAAQRTEVAQKLTESSLRAILGRRTPMFSALTLAGTDEKIRAEPEIWDADPWALGVPGGVIDLKTGNLKASARDQHLTMRAAVAPERGAPKLWLECLKQWLGDEDVISFLRRYLGYALTGDNREQCMAFFYGQAQSGKGTIMRAVSGIMGSDEQASRKFRSYHYEAPIQTFLESRSERHSTELAAFYKKRLITSEEPGAGAKWDEGKIKWITGGSQITARFIAQDNFSFTMTGKIIVAANHRPRLGTTDKAIRRRLHVIPFEHPVADEDRDNQLDAKLRAEWPQILNWLIEGCLEWQQSGLGLPERISDSTSDYLENEDTIGQWIAESTDRLSDSDGANLYRHYSEWCAKNGEHPWSRRAWANALVDRGFRIRRGTGGIRMFVGLSLKLP